MNNIQSTPPIKTTRRLSTIHYPLFLVLLCSLFLVQCKKTSVTTSSSAKLSFSETKLFFDTVFTSVGSSVRTFVVHNNNNEAVNTSINLQGYYPTFFNINVDGVSGSAFSNVQIPANDSIYVFVTLNVTPGNPSNPAFIADSLVFTTNGNLQSVELQGFGWDAYFYMPNMFPSSGPAYYLITPADTAWKNDKPHVIFGYLLIPPGLTLNIHEGTGVYLHDSAVIYVDSAATLNVMGTPTLTVNFQQDRLEPDYNYLPGQWNEIFMYKASNCHVSWAVIQDGQTGFEIDTVDAGSPGPALSLDHTIIKSMSSYGIFAAGTTINADDDLIADCQYGCVDLYIGGTYQFNQCTLADYWGIYNGYSDRTTSLLYLNNYYESVTNQQEPRDLKAFFGNCIVYGALDEEITLDSNYGAKFNYYFENCILKTKHNTLAGIHYDDSISKTDPLFNNIPIDQYLVASPGSATGYGNPGVAQYYPVDLNNANRPTTGATVGAYEQ